MWRTSTSLWPFLTPFFSLSTFHFHSLYREAFYREPPEKNVHSSKKPFQISKIIKDIKTVWGKFWYIFYQKIPLKSYFDFSVIYYIKSSVVALFSVKPMNSVKHMSVKPTVVSLLPHSDKKARIKT